MVQLPTYDNAERMIRGLLEESVRTGLLTHAVTVYGHLQESSTRLVVQKRPDGRDIFDLASITKALVTTPLVFKCLRKRGLPLSVTVGTLLGEQLGSSLDHRLRSLTIESLLSHQSGLPAWRNFWVCHLGVDDANDLVDCGLIRVRILEGLNRAAQDLKGSDIKQVYSDVGFLLLGFCLTELEGASLEELFWRMVREDFCTSPDQLDLYFGSKSPERDRTVPTSYCAVRERQLIGEVHDENAASLGGAQAHAGLFGTADAVASYLRLLARYPLGQDVLHANASAIVIPPGDPPHEALLGWRQGADPSSFPFAQGAAMGHMGFTGVAFWVCPTTQDYAILLTNRVISGRTRPGIAALRSAVFAAASKLRQ